MRSHTGACVLVCVIGASSIVSNASSLSLTFNQAPETVSIAEPTDLPPNITVSSTLHEVVVHMLRESETFRRQCRRIGSLPRVRVRIVLENPQGHAPARAARARCDLERYEFGGVRAFVHVWAREDAVELIAHELEHVIELVEGANLRALALVQPGSVWAADDGAFETARAIHAGVQVKREVWLANAEVRRRH